MKKRDFFKILVASVAGVVVVKAVQTLYRWMNDESEYEDELASGEEDEEIADAVDASYDEGFNDGMNASYNGSNPAAQVLQAELNRLRDKCGECMYGSGSDDEDESAVAGNEATEEQKGD